MLRNYTEELLVDEFELAPNTSKDIKVYYTVTQADVDSGATIANSVAVETEGGEEASDEDETIETDQTEGIDIEKEATKVNGEEITDTTTVKAGDVVEYVITVTNTGSVTAKGIEVTEGLDVKVGEEAEETKAGAQGCDREVLRRRYHQKAQTSREAEGRKEENASDRYRPGPSECIHGRPQARLT